MLAPGWCGASDFAAIYSFGVTRDDAVAPQYGLTRLGHALFGTSAFGGQPTGDGSGTIFRFDPVSGAETVVYSFGGGPSFPGRLMTLADKLYGTTATGASGNGGVYSFDTHSSVLQPLHAFAGGADGWMPTPEIGNWGGGLYGMTSRGGLADCPVLGDNTCGTVFGIDLASGQFQQLHAFADLRDGMFPTTGLQPLGGELYGATATTLVALNPVSGVLRTVHRFAGGSGSVSGSLVAVRGMLYGVTVTGGAAGDGALFAFDTLTGKFKILHSFAGGPLGARPSGSLAVRDGVLYGSTLAGGRHNNGSLFSYDLSTGQATALHEFAGPDGAAPNGDLLFFDGAFYGTTQQGGAANGGVIYRLTP